MKKINKKLQNKVILITGTTSGIGLATARRYVQEGCKVYALNRGEQNEEGITSFLCDVTNRETVFASVAQIAEKEGRIDIVINNAGIGIMGSIEDTDIARVRTQFEVNLFGVLNVCQAVLPVMRAQKSGKIINIGSVASIVALPFQSFYASAKAALLSLTHSLRIEVKPLGIDVAAVLPGDTRTGFTAARVVNENEAEAYKGRSKKSVRVMEHDEQNGLKPQSVANVIVRQTQKRRMAVQKIVGFKYKILAVLIKILPVRFVLFVVSKFW